MKLGGQLSGRQGHSVPHLHYFEMGYNSHWEPSEALWDGLACSVFPPWVSMGWCGCARPQ